MYIFIILYAILILIFYKGDNKKSLTLGNLFVFLIFAVGALRGSTVGTDIALHDDGYYQIWQYLFNYSRRIEPGFTLLTAIIKSLSSSYYIYYALIYILNIYLYIKACKLLGIQSPVFLACILLGGLLAPSFNVIRQMLALGLGIYTYSMILNRYNNKKISSIKALVVFELLIISIGFLFHFSCFLLSILPLFHIEIIKKILGKDIVLWGLTGVSLFIILVGQQYVIIVFGIIEGLFGERSDFWVNNYLKYADYAESSHGYMTFIINASLAILLSRKNRDSLFFAGFVGILLSGIAAASLSTIGRTFDNLTIFMLLFYAKYWFQIGENKKKSIYYFGLKSLRILFWLTSLYFTLLINESLNPYKTFLFE